MKYCWNVIKIILKKETVFKHINIIQSYLENADKRAKANTFQRSQVSSGAPMSFRTVAAQRVLCRRLNGANILYKLSSMLLVCPLLKQGQQWIGSGSRAKRLNVVGCCMSPKRVLLIAKAMCAGVMFVNIVSLSVFTVTNCWVSPQHYGKIQNISDFFGRCENCIR